MNTPYNLAQLGWDSFFARQCQGPETPNSFPARVSLIHRSHCILWSEQGQHDIPIRYFADKKDIAVGDWFLLSPAERQPIFRLQRKNLLSRKAPAERAKIQLMAANIDSLLIVSSCDQDFSESRIERYLAQAAETGITPVVILTKADLCNETEAFKKRVEALGDNLRVECLDARDGQQVARLHTLYALGQTVVFTGSSGVGKSTLINHLAEANQETCEVSDFNQKGRHTTTTRSLHCVKDGGVLLDTPGIRELQLARCEHGIETVFHEIVDLLMQCQYHNCTHQNDPGCALLPALADGTLPIRRWENYQTLLAEQAELVAAQDNFQKRQRRRQR